MGKEALDIHGLSRDERLQLLEEIWGSLDTEVEVLLTDAQRNELEARSRALDAGELTTAPLEDVLEAIRTRRASR